MSDRSGGRPAATSGVVTIGYGADDATLATPARVGFKAANLLQMARIGLPVPQAFVLDTEWSRSHAATATAPAPVLRDTLAGAMRELEAATALGFGDSRRPLLVSVRSGAAVSMPGMMDTLLNVGLNEASLRALVRFTGNPRLAWNSYRRLIQSFAETVRGMPAEPLAVRVAAEVERHGLASERELDFASERRLALELLELYRESAGEPFPQSPMAQLEAAVRAVIASADGTKAREYRRLHSLPDELPTAITVQRMVYGNAGGTSGAGVGFTRDPATGVRERYYDFLFNAQGEDVVSGRAGTDEADRLPHVLPEISERLDAVAAQLEREFGDMQEFEFTVQEGELFLLQTRDAKRTPLARLVSAVELAEDGVIDTAAALAMLDNLDLGTIAITRLDDSGGADIIAHGVAAGAGIAAGEIALDSEAAMRARDAGRAAILVRENAETADIEGMAAAAGLVTAHGSRTSHAAVVARQMGIVCVVGCASLAIDASARTARFGEVVLREGEFVSVAGEMGTVYRGSVRVTTERPARWLDTVARWRAAVPAALDA